MSKLRDVETFIERSRQVAAPSDLHELMQAITCEMQFDYFALVHHVDLRHLGTLVNHVVTDDFVALSTYPQAWVDQYISQDVVSNDPVLLASQRTNVGFGWEQIGEYITITAAHREITERTRKAGIMDGFTVPANVP